MLMKCQRNTGGGGSHGSSSSGSGSGSGSGIGPIGPWAYGPMAFIYKQGPCFINMAVMWQFWPKQAWFLASFRSIRCALYPKGCQPEQRWVATAALRLPSSIVAPTAGAQATPGAPPCSPTRARWGGKRNSSFSSISVVC